MHSQPSVFSSLQGFLRKTQNAAAHVAHGSARLNVHNPGNTGKPVSSIMGNRGQAERNSGMVPSCVPGSSRPPIAQCPGGFLFTVSLQLVRLARYLASSWLTVLLLNRFSCKTLATPSDRPKKS